MIQTAHGKLPSLFISGVATNAGKTYISRALARSEARRGRVVAALKPIETGVAPDPLDALALARASHRPELAQAAGLYRAELPLAPYAAALETGTAPPLLEALAARVRELAAGSDVLLVEGAGGLLVPIDRERTLADLARALALPLLLVARDELGVLSSVLTCVESARARELSIAAVILSEHRPLSADDASPRTNQRILQERVGCPVLRFPCSPDDDEALADAADRLNLSAILARQLAR